MNDYEGIYDGIKLHYGKVSGYGVTSDFNKGARVIILKEQMENNEIKRSYESNVILY